MRRKSFIGHPFFAPTSRRGTFDRTAHAAGSAPSPAELAARDRQHLDAGSPKLGVGVDVALVGDDDAGTQSQDVVAVVPLLALGLHVVAPGGEDADRRE